MAARKHAGDRGSDRRRETGDRGREGGYSSGILDLSGNTGSSAVQQMAEASNRSPRVQSQLQLARALNQGPRVAAQMRLPGSQGIASETTQRHSSPEGKETAQARCMGAAAFPTSLDELEEPAESSLEAEAMVQGKFAKVQSEEGTDDEDYPMQAKFDAAQREEGTDDEDYPMQAKLDAAQREEGTDDEDYPMQAKFDAAQREEGTDDEDYPMQAKFEAAQREEGTDDEDYPMQAKFGAAQRRSGFGAESIQRAPSTAGSQNRTGLPDNLKTGIENLSGRSLDDVKVHYNSPKPVQLNALAYTQGKDIHVGPGQQKHLAHEAWHVVQQAEGRVAPTMQMRGTAINDDSSLEREADAMGARATQFKAPAAKDNASSDQQQLHSGPGITIQRAVGFEFQSNWQIDPDPVSAVEGLVSYASRTALETLNLDEGMSMGLGILTGKLARMPLDAASSLLKGIGRLASWGFSKAASPQTVYRAEGYADYAHSLSQKAIIKGVPLIKRRGWEMSSDQGEMEFVTNHFDETDYDGLNAAMQSIRAFNDYLMTMQGRPSIPINDLPGATTFGGLAAIKPEATLLGVPQMTAGIDPSQILGMMQAMGAGGSRTQRNATRDRSETMRKIIANLPQRLLSRRSPQYKGLAAMMASYVYQSALLPAVTTEKDIATIMSRTNVGYAFKRTPEARQMTEDALKRLLLNDVLAAAQGAAADMGNYMVTNIDATMRLFPGEDPSLRTGPTVQQWVDGVVEGRDVTSAGMSRVTARSMGSWERMESVGPQGTMGIIAEFRNLPRDIDYTQWTAYAMNLMRWISVVNDPSKAQKKFPRQA